MIEKLKEFSDSGKVELAKLDNNNQPQKIQFNEFQAQVRRQDKHAKVFQSLEQLSWEEKYQWVNFRRLRANEIYREGNIDQALEEYLISLVGLDLKDQTDGRLIKMQNQLKYPILLNMATCLFRKKEYEKSIELCDKVLSENSEFSNAIYKKAYLMMETGRFDESKELIKKGFNQTKVNGDLKKMQEFQRLNADLAEKSKKNRQVYARIFNPECELDKQTDKLLEDNTLIPQQDKEQEILVPATSLLQKILECCSSCLNFLTPTNVRKIKKRNKHT